MIVDPPTASSSVVSRARVALIGCQRRRDAASPSGVACVVLLVATVVVLARLFLAAEGDVTKFIVAGDLSVDVADLPGDIHVFQGPGNDGQYNYRYALDPTELGTARHLGITIDDELRAGRIGYPLSVWFISIGGQSVLVPYVLVLVNVLGLASLGFFGATLASHAGQRPYWGAMLPVWFGFLFSLARNYADIAGAALAVGAVVLLVRSRTLWAALALSAAVLTREPYAALIGALILERAAGLLSDASARRVLRSDVVWLVPLTAFVSWQLYAASQVGEIPLLSAESNRSLPGVGIIRSLSRWISEIFTQPSGWTEVAMAGLSLLQFVVLIVFVFSVSKSIRSSAAPTCVRWAWLMLGALSLLLSESVWDALADFRNLSELAVLGSITLLMDSRDLNPPAKWLGFAWVVTLIPRLLRV